MIYITPDPGVCKVLMELGSQSLVILLKSKMEKQQKIKEIVTGVQ